MVLITPATTASTTYYFKFVCLYCNERKIVKPQEAEEHEGAFSTLFPRLAQTQLIPRCLVEYLLVFISFYEAKSIFSSS